MAVRRRVAPTPSDPGAFPAQLAAGPCIEDWAEPRSGNPARSAWRAWRAAVDLWAQQTSYPGGGYRAARELARICTPWSRVFLRDGGRADLADYLDGRRAEHPGLDT